MCMAFRPPVEWTKRQAFLPNLRQESLYHKIQSVVCNQCTQRMITHVTHVRTIDLQKGLLQTKNFLGGLFQTHKQFIGTHLAGTVPTKH